MPSTVIRRYAYREQDRALDVEFVSGRVYRYLAVPQPVAARLAEVRSKGGYFNRALRGRFRFVQLPAGTGWKRLTNISFAAARQRSGACHYPLGAMRETGVSPLG